MVSRADWCFELDVGASTPIGRREVDDLLFQGALRWAEARRLGIVGGYWPTSPEEDGAAASWRFRFGLCIREDGQSIPESQAGELLDLLRSSSEGREIAFRGGFRPFNPGETRPDI